MRLVIVALIVLGSSAQAATLSIGSYNMYIQTWSNSNTTLKSAVSFGQANDASTCTQYNCGLTDNGNLVRGVGSSIGGDGYAGVIGITVDGSGGFTVNSFQLDAYPDLCCGAFAIWANNLSGMNGHIDGSGNMTFDPTGRVAAMDFFPVFDNGGLGTALVYDDSVIPNHIATNAYIPFTTGTSCNVVSSTGATDLCLTGQALDSNGNAVLVSAGNFGAAWGASFETMAYSEIYSVHIQAVPIPAAIWLFSSGLLGLFGFRRVCKNS